MCITYRPEELLHRVRSLLAFNPRNILDHRYLGLRLRQCSSELEYPSRLRARLARGIERRFRDRCRPWSINGAPPATRSLKNRRSLSPPRGNVLDRSSAKEHRCAARLDDRRKRLRGCVSQFVKSVCCFYRGDRKNRAHLDNSLSTETPRLPDSLSSHSFSTASYAELLNMISQSFATLPRRRTMRPY